MKKFACICVYALGAIGGIGVALADHYWVIAAGVLGLAVLAFPTIRKVWNEQE